MEFQAIYVSIFWLKVGWARADLNPGTQLGSDESSWAFDGYNVSILSKYILF